MIKITGTLSYIKIQFDEKIVKISGEMKVNSFVAFKDSMKYWEAPYDKVEIDEETKQKIIQEAINETNDSKFKIIFE